MKYLIVLLLIFPVNKILPQSYSIDITNHPDTGFTYKSTNLSNYEISNIEREEYLCSGNEKLIPSGRHTYKMNKGLITEESVTYPNGRSEQYWYEYDSRGNVTEKKVKKINNPAKNGFPKIKYTRFTYEYGYDGCIIAVTVKSEKNSNKYKYDCAAEGNNRIITRAGDDSNTVFKYDFYDNLIEETNYGLFTNQAIKKITYKYTYNNSKPVIIKKIVGEFNVNTNKEFWSYNLEYTKKILYDENGNVKSILFADSKDKPFKLYKYSYNYYKI